MILVTGASGYLGSQVVIGLMAKKIPIRALKRETSIIPPSLLLTHSEIEWVNTDLGDIVSLSEVMKGVETVIHCASARYETEANPSEILRTNIQGTENLVNLSLDYSIKRFIHISSSVTMGYKDGLSEEPDSLLNEYNNLRSPFLYSKIESEKEVWRGIMEGLPAVVLNPGLILSSWDDPQKNPHLKSLYEKGSKYYFNKRFGIICIQDLIQTLLDLLDSWQEGRQWVLVSENISGLDLVSRINQRLGLNIPKRLLKKSFWNWLGLKESSSVIQSRSGIRELSKMVDGMVPQMILSRNPITGQAYKTLNDLF